MFSVKYLSTEGVSERGGTRHTVNRLAQTHHTATRKYTCLRECVSFYIHFIFN